MSMKKLVMSALQMDEEIVLPPDYVECYYLRSDGKCYIPTQYSGDDIIVETVLIAEKHSSTYMVPFGAYGDYLGFALFHYSDIGWSLSKADGKNFSFQPYERVQVKTKFSTSELYIECWMNNTLDGVYQQYHKRTASKLQQNYGFNLFSPRAGVGADAFVGYMERTKIYDFSGNLIADYIPVLRIGGTPGFYDNVGGKFWQNRGSGQLGYQLKTQ